MLRNPAGLLTCNLVWISASNQPTQPYWQKPLGGSFIPIKESRAVHPFRAESRAYSTTSSNHWIDYLGTRDYSNTYMQSSGNPMTN